MSFTAEDKEWLQKHFATKEELDHKLELQAVRLEYHFDRKIDDLVQLTAQSFSDLHEYLDENFQRIEAKDHTIIH